MLAASNVFPDSPIDRSRLPIPCYRTLSRRAEGLAVALPRRSKNEPLHVVIDSTELKIYGEGAWRV